MKIDVKDIEKYKGLTEDKKEYEEDIQSLISLKQSTFVDRISIIDQDGNVDQYDEFNKNDIDEIIEFTIELKNKRLKSIEQQIKKLEQ